MVSLEQVKLLESKVTNTIEYIKKVTGENVKLKEKLDSYQKRIEELEVLVQQFKENQGRIEDGILSALDRLNQFEDAVESKLSIENKQTNVPPAAKIPEEEKIPDAADGELDIF
jgi:predicted nuclease with TOPRIM domain